MKHRVKDKEPKYEQEHTNDKAREDGQKPIRAVSFHINVDKIDGKQLQVQATKIVLQYSNLLMSKTSLISLHITVYYYIKSHPNVGNISMKLKAKFYRRQTGTRIIFPPERCDI